MLCPEKNASLNGSQRVQRQSRRAASFDRPTILVGIGRSATSIFLSEIADGRDAWAVVETVRVEEGKRRRPPVYLVLRNLEYRRCIA